MQACIYSNNLHSALKYYLLYTCQRKVTEAAAAKQHLFLVCLLIHAPFSLRVTDVLVCVVGHV